MPGVVDAEGICCEWLVTPLADVDTGADAGRWVVSRLTFTVVVFDAFGLRLVVAVLVALFALKLAVAVDANVVVAIPALVVAALAAADFMPVTAAVVDGSALDAVSVNITAGAVGALVAGLASSVAGLKVVAEAFFAAVVRPGAGLEPVPIHNPDIANAKAAATPAIQPILLRFGGAASLLAA